jgi:hypothetical protein
MGVDRLIARRDRSIDIACRLGSNPIRATMPFGYADRSGAEVMSNTQLQQLLASEPNCAQDEFIRINTKARPRALQFARVVGDRRRSKSNGKQPRTGWGISTQQVSCVVSLSCSMSGEPATTPGFAPCRSPLGQARSHRTRPVVSVLAVLAPAVL